MTQILELPPQLFYAIYVAAYGIVGVLLFLSVIITRTFFIAKETHRLVNSELAEWKRAVKEAADIFAASERRAGVREGEGHAEELSRSPR